VQIIVDNSNKICDEIRSIYERVPNQKYVNEHRQNWHILGNIKAS